MIPQLFSSRMVPIARQWDAFFMLKIKFCNRPFFQKIGPEKANFLKNTNFVKKKHFSLYRAMIEKNEVSTIVKMFQKVNYGVRLTK